MKKGLIKALVLSVVFSLSTIIFGKMTDETNEDLTTKMDKASLPVVCMYYEDQKINELAGYTVDMDARYMRDDIIPLNEELTLPIEIKTYGAKVSDISYEVRSMDTERLIEDTVVEDYKNEGNSIKAELDIQNLIEDNKEYVMIFTIKSDGKDVHYYSRITKNPDSYVKETIDFAKDFHDQTWNYDETKSTLATYLEPKGSADNSSFNKVSINSSLSQVTWGGFNGHILGDVDVSIKEINSSYNVIKLNYMVTADEENGCISYYNVEEFYRVRYTDSRIYLLNFDREMQQIFKGEGNSFTEDQIQLGIRDAEVEYAYNENNSIVCFVQEGEMWSYNQSENKLARIFSFRDVEGMDARENNDQHDIRIIQVNETGNVDFVVLGYMNRGNHEGEVGTCIYHYDSVTNTIEEELFIPSDKSYQVMKEDLGELMYENTDSIFYLMSEGSLYEINLKDKKADMLIEGLVDGMYCISESNQYVACAQSGNIIIYNLKTQEQYEIKADEGTGLRPLGFMGTDFIYGISSVTDGSDLFSTPMYSVRIIDTEGKDHELLKNYQKDGYYIANININGNSINLSRVQFNGTAYVEVDPDIIKNNENTDEQSTSGLESSTDEIKELQHQLKLKSKVSDKSPRLLTTNEIIASDDVILKIELGDSKGKYYAYANGKVIKASTSLVDVINAADEAMGIVVDDRQNYIWKRAKKTAQAPIEMLKSTEETSGNSVAHALSSLLGKEELSLSTSPLLESGQTPIEILKDAMKDKNVFELMGCDLEKVLYYVNIGNPVFAMSGNGTALLITGYDLANVYLFDGLAGETQKMSIEDAKVVFSTAGNDFVVYIK